MLRRIVANLLKSLRSLFKKSAHGFYEDYWKIDRGSYSTGFVPQACELFTFNSVLDAGCGNGNVVREFLACGKDAIGIELSHRAVQDNCPDLLEQGRVLNGSLTDLPFQDGQFDLVFSSEVLEHLTEQEAGLAAKEMVRVCKKHLFMTISLRPSQHNNAYHITIKPRSWWEDLFCSQGCVVLRDVVDRCQVTQPNASNRQIVEAGPAKALIDEMDWFFKENAVDFKGELEPWFFAFEKSNETKE
jgi:SAM-dependent methyltransferase